ncbi:unnamed protein product, partial [Porites evermanni]
EEKKKLCAAINFHNPVFPCQTNSPDRCVSYGCCFDYDVAMCFKAPDNVCDVDKYDSNRRNCGWKGITKTECENRGCCFDDAIYRNHIPTYDCHYRLDMPKCIVSERENCGYGGITDRECVEKLGCCWDSSVRNVPWYFHGRDKIGRCTVSERTNCGFKEITEKQCVKDRGCCWDFDYDRLC